MIVIVVSLYRHRFVRYRFQPVKLPGIRCGSENNHNNHYECWHILIVVIISLSGSLTISVDTCNLCGPGVGPPGAKNISPVKPHCHYITLL